MIARLSARDRSGPHLWGGLGKCVLMRRHNGLGTQK